VLRLLRQSPGNEQTCLVIATHVTALALSRPLFRPLPRTASMVLLASIVVSFLAASAAPTPLYPVYAADWGFTPITTTVVFGVYALAVLVALLTVGELSDYVGRRPVVFAGLALQAASMVVFATAGGVGELLLARVVQGLATGAVAGAVGAGLLDLDRARGPLANSIAPITGTATGALVSGIAVQYLPAPTHLIYLLLIAVFAVQALGMLLVRETVSRKPGALASLKLEVALPQSVRRSLLVAAPVLVAVWGLGGFYASLGPALIRDLLGSDSLVWGGLVLGTLAGSGAIAVLALRNLAPRRVMLIGIGSLILGVAITLVAIGAGSAAGFFAGSLVAGVGFGAGFQGAVRTVVPKVAAHERAGVLSIVYTVSYLALGLPAVLAGIRVAHGGALTTTAQDYGLAVIALAAVALLGLVRKS
jgi:MFS family permease